MKISSFRGKMCLLAVFLSQLFLPPLRAMEGQRYLVSTGLCEGTATNERPQGYPVLLKLDTQTGESWVLIRVREYPYNFFWEKVADVKPRKVAEQ